MPKGSMKIGDRVNQLTLVERIPGSNGKARFLCDCGGDIITFVSRVLNHEKKNCGCVSFRKPPPINIKHGRCGTPLYNAWNYLRNRDGPGLRKNCESWNEFVNFEKWALTNNYSEDKRLVRHDPSTEYSPENCSWEQSSEAISMSSKRGCQDKYGYDNPFQVPHIKEKCKESVKVKYGVDNVAFSPEVEEVKKNNNRNKFGTDYPVQHQDIKDKIFATRVSKGLTVLHHDMTISTIAIQHDYAESAMRKRIKRYGYEKAIRGGGRETYIEYLLRNILDKYNIDYYQDKVIEKRRADFVLKNYNLIIECDGLFWHCDKVQADNSYHRKKKDFYESKGYQCLFFREDEIMDKLDIIESIIINKIGLSDKIFARKTAIRKLSKEETSIFVEMNHLMGKGAGQAFGLIFQNELVAALQLVRKQDHIEVSRFCTKQKTNVIGGFSKLLKHAERLYLPKTIGTFIDQRYGSGKYLEQLGFNMTNCSLSYRWVKNNKSYHRLKYRKNSGYDVGCSKLWDCGQAHWIKNIV